MFSDELDIPTPGEINNGWAVTDDSPRIRVTLTVACVECGHVRTCSPARFRKTPSKAARDRLFACPQCGNGATRQDRGGATQDPSTKGIYHLWRSMLHRCGPTAHPRTRADYYGRGIRVEPVWREDWEGFRDWCIANGYRKGLQLDRRDTNGNYSPDNCRFVTPIVNTMNRRNTVFIEAWGERKTLVEWLDDPRCKATYWQVQDRIRRSNPPWDAERALSTPGRAWKRRTD